MEQRADHKALYKNSALDSRELRRRREEDTIQLRKQKRDDVWTKRRLTEPEEDKVLGDSGGWDDELWSVENNPIDDVITPHIVESIMQNENTRAIHVNAIKIRKILSREPQPPIQDVLNSELMPRFIELLDRHDEPLIQFEVAWILTNICSGTTENTREVVKHGAIPKLVNLCSSPNERVCEQSVWALGNIIGDGAELRDLVIAHNFVPVLLNLIKPGCDVEFLRNLTWVIVNLCRNKDPPPFQNVIKEILPALSFLIQSTDLTILVDTTWAISYVTELGLEYSRLVVDSGILCLMTPLCSHKDIKIQTATIRALGSIAAGDDHQTQALIDSGALPHLYHLMKNNKNKIIKEALWFISNITAGSQSQIQAIFDNKLIPLVIYFLTEGEFSQQREASWVMLNICITANSIQLQELVNQRVLPPLCDLLNVKDRTMVKNILQCINNIFKTLHHENPQIAREIEECGGLDKLEGFLQDKSPEIYKYASDILERYFPDR